MKFANRFVVACRRTAARGFARFSTSGLRSFRASRLPGSISATIMNNGKETIQLRLDHRTAWITLDRPPLNILDISMMQALDAALERAIPKCDFVIFQCAGPKAFSAGVADRHHTPERVQKIISPFTTVFLRLARA